MSSKFSSLIPNHNGNILQPKHLNSAALNSNEQRDGITAGVKVALQQSTTPAPTGNYLNPIGGIINNGGIDLAGLNGFTDSVGCTNNGIPQRKGPNTMAKRNARERNRVKLVNQGFQTLRHHIPEDYRVKKMSKVDVLRCALYYIRSLEQKLQLPFLADDEHEYPSTVDGLMNGGNSSVDAYNFCEGVLSRQQLERMSYEQHISSMSKSTSSDLGEGDSTFSFSDDDDLSKDGIKKQRLVLAQDHNMCPMKKEPTESYVYHQYTKEETVNSNKPLMRAENYKSQIFMMVGGNNAKITHGSIESHHLEMGDNNHLEPQSVKEEMENNDENYHAQAQWDEKVGV